MLVTLYSKSENLESVIEILSELRYDGIEVEGEPEQYDVKEISQLLESHNLKASSVVGMYPWPTMERDLSSPDENIRRRRLNTLRNA